MNNSTGLENSSKRLADAFDDWVYEQHKLLNQIECLSNGYCVFFKVMIGIMELMEDK